MAGNSPNCSCKLHFSKSLFYAGPAHVMCDLLALTSPADPSAPLLLQHLVACMHVWLQQPAQSAGVCVHKFAPSRSFAPCTHCVSPKAKGPPPLFVIHMAGNSPKQKKHTHLGGTFGSKVSSALNNSPPILGVMVAGFTYRITAGSVIAGWQSLVPCFFP